MTDSRIYTIAADYVDRWAALDPIGATEAGVPGHDTEMTDYSPAGVEARARLDRETLAALAEAPVEGERDRIARDLMVEKLDRRLEWVAAEEHLRQLRVLDSPMQHIRSCFDLMPRATAADWETIATRLARVPGALAGYQTTLREGLRRNQTAARRQAIACAEQAAVWSGQRENAQPFFQTLVEAYDATGIDEAGLRARLEEGARRAGEAYAGMRRFLVEEYASRATERDPVGPERYAAAARTFTGIDLDLPETYAWGWEELSRIERELSKTAAKILPGAALADVIELLETDPARAIEGVEAFRRWMQDLQDRAVAELNGVHFDIPEPVQRIEALIAPPGGALAAYYTGPSEDFSRPGRTWYPTGGRTRFPLWDEVSTAYHEGVPGHHLQIGQVVYLAGELSRYQRLLGWLSGHGEGWALYAERLMAELGYLENPDYYLGMLRGQAMRAARVIVDIGLHLELPIPRSDRFHPGETWTPDLALSFLIERGQTRPDFAKSEIDRYLGWPGQAISYKVGERVWLAVREEVKRRRSSRFDLKEFHTRALSLGPLGLAQMQREMANL